jgi:diacylglycerol kinase family enzyme
VKIPVVLNRGAGAAEQAEMLTTAFRGEGREIEILECSGEEIGDACRRAAEGPSPLVVAAGGDGTVSAVAG